MNTSVELYKCRVCGNIVEGSHLRGQQPIESYFAYFLENATRKRVAACTVKPEDHVGIADLVGWKPESSTGF